jgi:hypothetical protein
MRLNRLTSTILVVVCALFLPTGCEEEQAVAPRQLSPDWFRQFEQPAQPAVTARARTSAPKIAFEEVLHDFGVVGPETSSICEFGFKNTGTGILRFGEINSACGCTTFALAKTEYAPGETGALRVKYSSDTQLGPTTKELLVSTNDTTNPEVALTIKATVTAKVDYEPKTLNLVLRQEKCGLPRDYPRQYRQPAFRHNAFHVNRQLHNGGLQSFRESNEFRSSAKGGYGRSGEYSARCDRDRLEPPGMQEGHPRGQCAAEIQGFPTVVYGPRGRSKQTDCQKSAGTEQL